MSAIPADVQALIDKAHAIEAQIDACEKSGGHTYVVQDFSAIAHPEVMFPPYRPNVPSVTEGITFSSYHCARCPGRVTVEEGRRYIQEKYRRANMTAFGDGDGTYSWLDYRLD